MDRIRIPSTVHARLRALGFSPEEILRRARLPPSLFQHERIVVTTAQWFALWEALETYIDDPAFGLRFSRMVQGEPHDPLSITALSASSFQEALSKVARYKRLFSAEEIRLLKVGNSWGIEASWYASQKPPPPLLIDVTFSHMMEVGRRGTGRDLYPERVVLRREETNRSLYEAHFQCPVDFGADRDMLWLSDEAMMQRFSTANPDLLAMLEPQLEMALRDSFAQPGFVDQVKQLLRSRIAGQEPGTQDVARELHISSRTLQRRLADEGVQFQQLLENVRHEMAKEYLVGSSLELSEIAFLLGYKETSSFHRAFHQWEGSTPGQWRTAKRQAISTTSL